jgi:hypothetical protein
MSDDTAQIDNSLQSNDSTPANVPLEAPETPASEVVSSPVKDDNLSQNTPESQPSQRVEMAQTGEVSTPATEPTSTPPTPPETQSAQTPPSDPIVSKLEPIPESVQTDSSPVFSTPAEPVPAPISSKTKLARDLLNKARQVIQNRKQKKIDHVMDLFAKRTNITNDEVEKFLHVSDATATRYLEILEKENKIRQTGKTGKGVVYTKI